MKIWNSKEIKLEIKLKGLDFMSVFSYATDTWTVRKAGMCRLKAFEMKCFR